MKNFKKGIITALASLMMLAGCGSSSAASAAASTSAAETTPAESTAAATETTTAIVDDSAPVNVRVTAMIGPTAMGMVHMMDQVDKGEITSENYSFELLSAVDKIAPKVAKGEADIIAVPANLGAVLYNNTDKSVQALAVNTLGVLYICETGEAVNSVADLKGRTIYASGKGASPEYALDYILSENGIDPETDVTIEWQSEHAECVAALANDPEGIALLPQPFVTAAQAKNDKIRVALDLTEEWDKVQENKEDKSSLVTGILIVRKAFAEEHPEAVEDFMNHYAESVAFANDNVDEAAALIGGYDIIAEPVAKKALPYCNIVDITGTDMKTALSGYLSVLYNANPKSVGGALPEDDFYYGAQ